MKSQQGFTIIELMIVVAVMGVLATIATFTYSDMVGKSRRSQVKAELSGAYNAMKTFQTEWNQYFGDFNTIAYNPEGSLYYRIGFEPSSKAGSPVNPAHYVGEGLGGGTAAAAVSTVHSDGVCGTTAANPCSEATSTCALTDVGACVWNANSFVLCGCGDISEGGAIVEDRWTLDEQKNWTRVSF